jgi:hypothetical protein
MLDPKENGMAMSWLTALKVIPWSDVIEHGPKVVEKARDMLNKRKAAQNPPADDAAEGSPGDELSQLRLQVMQWQGRAAQMQNDLEQQAQTTAELAEQTLACVQAIVRLKRWMLVGGVLWALTVVGVVVLALKLGV